MKIGKRRIARINCAISLYLYDVGKLTPQEILESYLPNLCGRDEDVKFDIRIKDPQTKEFYKNLFLTAISKINEIDNIIQNASKKWDFGGLYPIDKAILRMATAEMIYIKTDVPVVIDEAVEISKMYSPVEDKGPRFINGVLDTIAKNGVIK